MQKSLIYLSNTQVVAGAHHRILEAGHQKRDIASMEYNADFNNPQFNNDVALITVSKPFDFTDNNIQSREMFKGSDAKIPPETICNITGWGHTSGVGLFLSNALQWSQLPEHSHEECEEIFPSKISDGMICAGSKGHTSCIVS